MTTHKPGDHWLDDYVPYRLYRVTHKLNSRLLTRLRDTKLSPSKWRVLSVLRASGTLSLTGIVEQTLMRQPTVSRVVARLEREGRVVREPSRQDSRVVRVRLTAKGMQTFAEVVPTALRHQSIALEGVPRRDLDVLVRVLERIERNIEQ